MEFLFIFLLGFALAEENRKQDEKIQDLIEWNYRLSGGISALSAREKMNNDLQKTQIEYLVTKMN
jgi:hypothetical protein